MEDGADIREHVNKFFDTVDKLEEMEIEINKDLLSIMLLYSMPSNFEHFRCAIESRDELPSPEALRVKILEEYEARKNKSRINLQNAMLSVKDIRKRRPPIKSKYERKKSIKSSSDKGEFKYRCDKCHEIGHKTVDCESKKKGTAKKAEDVSFFADAAFKAQSAENKGSCCLDSGATSHLTNNSSVFTNVYSFNKGKINLANDLNTDIVAKGTAKILADVTSKNLFLNNTLHVPDLRSNLISVAKVTDKKFKVIFSKKYAEVVDDHGDVKMIAHRSGDLYFVREVSELDNQNVAIKDSSTELNTDRTCKESSAELWHRRLGHLNYRDLYTACKKGVFRGIRLPDINNDVTCEICLKEKMTALPKTKRSDRKSDLLEIVHTDVCGPMRCESLGKSRFFVTFIDDASR